MLYISFKSFHRFPERRHMWVLLLPHFSTLLLGVLRRKTKVRAKDDEKVWAFLVGFTLVEEEIWRRRQDLEELREGHKGEF